MVPTDSLTLQTHGPRHQNHYPMYFSLKVMAQNVFLHNGGEHYAPLFANIQTAKDLGLIKTQAST